MQTIEIDFEVYKQLTLRRATEAVTYNDVIRELLNLPASPPPPSGDESRQSRSDWVTKGVSFPDGTEFRVNYKGVTHVGKVENAALVVKGQRFDSPSAAAMSITQSAVNGWRFWECKLPGSSTWRSIATLRR